MALQDAFLQNPWIYMNNAFEAFKAGSPEETRLLEVARKFADIDLDGICFLCRQLPLKDIFQREVRREDEDLEWHLGLLPDLVERQRCRICAFFVAIFERNTVNGKLLEDDKENYFITLSLRLPTVDRRILNLRLHPRGSEKEVFGQTNPIYVPSAFDKHLEHLKTSHISLSEHTDRRFDITVAKHWLETCKKQHSSCHLQTATANIANSIPPMVLDVQKLCIVPTTQDSEYAALSYVWGGIPVPRPQMATNRFCVDYSSIEQLLPLTIRDSIHLVKMMGIQYLWVDSLCIDQSDPADVESQVSRMDTFYESATLTIIAAAGIDSTAGLPGIGSLSRGPLVLSEKFGDLTLTTSLGPNVSSSLMEMMRTVDRSKWNTRGWCYQERAFSRRCLIFTPLLVSFICRSSTWNEYGSPKDAALPIGRQGSTEEFDVLFPVKKSLFHRLRDAIIPSTAPFPWAEYGRLVTNYSERQLTYNSDVLRAFQGVTSRLMDAYNVEIIWGIPLSCLDLALCWVPSKPVLLKIRSGPIFRGPRRLSFPSWSWASWDGPVLYFGDFNAAKVITWHILRSNGEVRLVESRIDPRLEYMGVKRISESEKRSLILTSTGSLSQRNLQYIKQTYGTLYADMNRSLLGIGTIPEGVCFHIVFETASAFFNVVTNTPLPDSKASNATQQQSLVGCKLVNGHGKTVSLGTITLEYAWYSANKNKPVECVCVGADVDAQNGEVQRVKVMLLDSHGIADVRIGYNWISRDDWCSAEDRKERLVILG